jgi:hypothetical protein
MSATTRADVFSWLPHAVPLATAHRQRSTKSRGCPAVRCELAFTVYEEQALRATGSGSSQRFHACPTRKNQICVCCFTQSHSTNGSLLASTAFAALEL